MLIAIDLDEVLADTLTSLIKYHNNEYDTSFRRADFFSYSWWEVWGGTREESIKKFMQFSRTSLFTSIKPIAQSQKGILTLSQKHSLHVVTSRQSELASATHSWINTHFPGMFTQVHVINHPQWALGGSTRTKGEYCKEMRADLLIEDSLEYARECNDFSIPVLLIDSPWNQGVFPSHTVRVNDWEDVTAVSNNIDFSSLDSKV